MLNNMLIIHESQIICKLISSYAMAELQGVAVDKTHSSAEGLKLIKENHYDVIISGTEMAAPDGFELNRQKHNTELNAETPLILITSNQSESQKIRMVKEGIDYYIFTPFSGQELAKMVELALDPRARRRYDRYGIPGPITELQLESGPQTANVINISLSGMLIELEYEAGMVVPWSPVKMDVHFPEDFGLARVNDVTAVLLRHEVIQRRDDHLPQKIRMAWMFTDLPVAAERTLKMVIEQADKDVTATIEELDQIESKSNL